MPARGISVVAICLAARHVVAGVNTFADTSRVQSWTAPMTGYANILLVGGGGGGGGRSGGGGGGGGVLEVRNLRVQRNTIFAITVGAGGQGGHGGESGPGRGFFGANGGDSTLSTVSSAAFTLRAVGGGGGTSDC